MFREFVILPGVLSGSDFETPAEHEAYLQVLRQGLTETTTIRDLRAPEWSKCAENRCASPRGKALLEMLAKRGAFTRVGPHAATAPTSDEDWLQEAQLSHNVDGPLAGVVVTESVAHKKGIVVSTAPLASLAGAGWWRDGTQSMPVPHTAEGFRSLLRPLLRRFSRVQLIDPYLDPTAKGYGYLLDVLLEACVHHGRPEVWIHRKCEDGSGKAAVALGVGEWRARFAEAWGARLQGSSLAIEVCLWDRHHEHDRFVLTPQVGIIVGDSFQTSKVSGKKTRAARLDRRELEALDREHDYRLPLNSANWRGRFRLGRPG